MSNALPATEDRAEYLVRRVDNPLSEVQLDSVLQRYEDGETIREIAASFGVSHVAVYRALVRNAPDLWAEYQSAVALKEYQEAEDALRRADDGVTVARAAHDLRSQQWKLERVLRRIYGEDKAQIAAVQVNITMDFTSNAAVLPHLSTEQEKDITPK
jgi:IS30 family transposase